MLGIYQICFDAKSRNNCLKDERVNIYFNNEVDKYFENSVIVKLIGSRKHQSFDYFGVFSHQFLKTRYKGAAHNFSFDALEAKAEKVDIVGFHPFMKRQKIFHNQEGKLYDEIFNKVCEGLNIKFNASMIPTFIIMQNHFVAKSEVYEDYVNTFLKPAIEILEQIPEANQRTNYKKSSKVNYTFHTFILERLISTYIHVNRRNLTYNFYNKI